MSIVDQLDSMFTLGNMEKEARAAKAIANVAKAVTTGGKKAAKAIATAEKPVESYSKGAVSAGPGFKSSVSSVPTEGPRSVKTSFTQGSKAPVPSKSVEPSFNSSQTQVGKGFSGTIKTNPVQPGPTSLNHSFTQSSKPAAPAPSGVDRSGMTVSQLKPEEAYRRSLGERFSTSWKNFKQNMTGNTLEKRRASAEEFHNNQQSNLVGTYKKTDTPAAPVNEKDIDRSNMQVRQKDQPAPEDDKPKWYKNKEVMKGVGLGVAGAAGVGLAAHALSNRNNQQNNGPQGYY